MSEEQTTRNEEQENISEDPGKITIFGKTLDCDFLDADFYERFVDTDQRLIDELSKREEFSGPDNAESMRKQCRLVDRFFNELFGEGTSEQLFSGYKFNLGKHMEAFQMVVDKAQSDPLRINDILKIPQSGQPTMNRAMRRMAQRAKGTQIPTSYRDRLEKAEHGGTDSSEADSTESEEENLSEEISTESIKEILAGEGITKEQFEQAMAIIKGNEGQ